MNIRNKLGLIIALSFFLVSCTKGTLPVGYKFNLHSKEGLAVISVSCNAFKPDDGDPYLLLFSPTIPHLYSVPVNCASPGEKLSNPQLKIMNLDPGNYHFEGFQQNHPWGVSYLDNFKNIYFDVRPGHISYLGWLKLQRGDSAHVSISLSNAAKRDIPLFRKTAPNVIGPVEIEKPHVKD